MNLLKKNIITYGIRQTILFILSALVNMYTIKKINSYDFGLFVIYNSIIGAMSFLTNGSVWAGFIQSNDDITERFINKMITLVTTVFIVVSSIFMAIIFLFHLDVFFQFYIIYFSLPVVALTGVQTVIYSKLQKDMHISIIAYIDIISNLIYYITVLILVLYEFGLYALLLSLLLKSIVATLMTVIIYKRRIRFDFYFFDKDFFKNLKNGLVNLLSFPFDYLRTLFNPVIVGNLCGLSSVGVVDRAVLLCGIPSNIMTVAVQKVLFPVFSKSLNTKHNIKAAVRKAIFYISFLDKLFYIPLILLIKPFVDFYFGEKWNGLIIPVYILSVGNMIFGGISSVLSVCVLSLGLFKKNTLINLSQTLSIIPIAFLLCYLFGVNGYVISGFILWFWTYYIYYVVEHSLGHFPIIYEFIISILISVPLGIVIFLINLKIEFINLFHATMIVTVMFYPVYIIISILIDKKYLRPYLYTFISRLIKKVK
jgi:O-antigen/teichoic acid export membrane protein